ncbi:FadR/GntR family transcriptional regulator [Microbacterium flavescens]|uniref:FadR/GntR family transcriptional regulator n=1 Tax=Microbacterium flavescens TaxID=69366 RepID=UPI001BDE7528|nr:FCD domain-containing protein [Microbacterium flavescens]BFF09979.1 FadR/GntR family transcriptional regulator [Microbacterium flavescens]
MQEPLARFVARLLELATVDEETGARRLPPERELGDALGMSRGALREQLSVLESLGFLHRTQGRGTYLDTPSYGFVRTYFAIARSLGYITDPHVSEARMLIEEAVAEAAARKVTPPQLNELRDSLDRMNAAEEAGDIELAHEADADFHRRLLDVVDNPVLQLLREGLQRALSDDMRARREAVARDGSGGEFDLSHEDIFAAIAAGDPEGARMAMRRHFGIATTAETGVAARRS